jgi:signal transduction histidine kinase
MLERLERSFASARRFSADAAHELRTPLTILKGELGVALRSAGSLEEYRRALESCEEEVDRLSALVEDLLFLARADAGTVELPWTEVDLSGVAAEAEPALAALAERAGVKLEERCRSGVRVRGSEPMLFRVFFNLVENAIKYSGAGHRVEVSLEPRAGEAVLEVRDDGRGMSREEQQHAFERFYRSEPVRGSEGAGLGLAIVRSVVALHGGAIDLESETGKGTLVRMTLPLAH